MSITYTQTNVVMGNYEIWKREVSEGKMTIELGWMVTSKGTYPDESWSVWHRDVNYNSCLEWLKEKIEEDKEEAKENDN